MACWLAVAAPLLRRHSACRPLAGGIRCKGTVGARGATEQGGEARNVISRRDRAVRLIAAEHQTQVENVPGRQHGLETLLQRVKIVATITDRAAKRLAPDSSDIFAGQAVRTDQRVDLPAKRHAKYQAELEAVTKRHGFKDFAEYETVAANIWLVMAQIDPGTKMFADPQILIKKEIEDASADKTIPDSER